jgi:hypothetical protein
VKIDFRVDGGALQSVTLLPEQSRKISEKKSIVVHSSHLTYSI